MDTEKTVRRKRFKVIRRLLVHIRRYLIAGILVMLPVVVTIWVLWNVFAFIDGVPKRIPGQPFANIPGVGVVMFFGVIILVGIFATNIIGKRLISFGERIMARIPLANRIYSAVQQISTAFIGTKRSIFSKAVLVEYPRKGIYSLGFVTSEAEGEVQHRTAQRLACVFMPTTPNPTSGLLIFVPREELIYLDMTTEDGLKLVISGGVVTPLYKGEIE
ncbi:MAG: DUF502 domain-containing protein, partial [Candidatus Hydrogenedentota bacterium]